MRKNSGIVFVPGNERQGHLPLAGRGVKDHARYHAAPCRARRPISNSCVSRYRLNFNFSSAVTIGTSTCSGLRAGPGERPAKSGVLRGLGDAALDLTGDIDETKEIKKEENKEQEN
jgi:hypothetical protein